MQKIDFNEDQVKNVNLSQEQIDDMKGYMTVACFGVDSRSQHGQMNVGKGTNADVNMIANINRRRVRSALYRYSGTVI